MRRRRANAFWKWRQTPSFIELTGPYTFPENNTGNTSIANFKEDKTRAAEANEAIANTRVDFYGVPGFTYALKLASSLAMSLSVLGLA